MKTRRYNIWAVLGLLLFLISIVLLFPVASDNKKIYAIILFCSIGIIVVLLLFLIWVHILPTSRSEEQSEKKASKVRF
jgi:NADH:ubiquinone oxidoreductase subunit 3 (subunit A)